MEFLTDIYSRYILIVTNFHVKIKGTQNNKVIVKKVQELLEVEVYYRAKIIAASTECHERNLKSDNHQYNMLAHWVDGTNDSLTKRLMFQALFFS